MLPEGNCDHGEGAGGKTGGVWVYCVHLCVTCVDRIQCF